MKNGLLLLSTVFVLAAAPLAAEELKFRHTLTLSADTKGVGLNRPEGIACGSDSVLVADTGNNRLLRYVIQEGSVKEVQEILNAEMVMPVRVKQNSQGELFVLDARQRRVLRLGPQGEPRGPVELKDVPGGRVPGIKSFTVGPDDLLYLLDAVSERVVVTDGDGNFKRAVLFPAEYGFFSDIAVDQRGTIFVVDSTNAGVYSAAKGGKLEPLALGLRQKARIGFPVAVAVDAKDRICLTDRNNGSLVLLARDGTYLGTHLGRGWAEGLLRYPQQSCTTEQGALFVADGGNSRVQMFLPAGSSF